MGSAVLSTATAARLVEAAAAAPSLHNTQPWQFVVSLAAQTVDIHADPSRALPHADPQGRGVHIACGAALLNLRLAVGDLGGEPVVRLLPSAADPLLLATVRIAGARQIRREEHDLRAAIGRRHTCRRPFTGPPVPQQVQAELMEAAAAEGASLRFLSRDEVRRVLFLTAAADRELRADDGYLRELADWTAGDRPHDGIPAALMAPATASPHPPVRSLSAASRPRPQTATFEDRPQLAILTTRSSDRVAWLRAGQALQRVLLLATHRGVVASPLTQALEVPDAPLRRDSRGIGEQPQMILRVGYAHAGAASPRRPVGDILTVIGAAASADGR
ncbi:MAG: Acg family FMN-binding oxidoreductase [Streptosporangiaceae bacterium]|jgi:hypothetical protein